MSRTEAIKKLYEECKDLDIEETMELVLNADTEDEQEFFTMLGDYLLQKKQEQVISQKRY